MLTLVEKDRIGLVSDILYELMKCKILVNSLNVEVILGKAVIFLTLSDPERGRIALKDAGYDVLDPRSTLIILKRRTEDLLSVTDMLAKIGVSVQKVRTLAESGEKHLVCILSDNPKKIAGLLKGSVVAAVSLD